MDYANTIIGQIIAMFVIMFCGGILYKKGLITTEGNKSSNNILLYLVTAVIIFNAFQREYDPAVLAGLGMALVFSFLAIGLSIVVSKVFFHPRLLGKNAGETEKRRLPLERFSSIYTNCGFFGIPIVSAVLGEEGVLYLASYLVAFYLLAWSHGLSLITGKVDKKNIMEVFRTPMIPMLLLGLLTFIFEIRLPAPIQTGLNFIGDLNTPLAMLVAGVSIAQSDLLEMLKNKRIYYTAFVGLVAVPMVVIGIFSLIPGFTVAKTAVLIATCCPAGAMATMLSIRFGGDYKYSAQTFAMSTLLSVFTMPLMVIFMQKIG